MTYIAPLGFVEVYDLAASLRARVGQFRPGAPRLLPVRGPRKDGDPGDVETFVWWGVAKWPELRSVLARIKEWGKQAGGIELGRIEFEMLDPGMMLPWSRDESEYRKRFLRAALPIRTNPGAVMVCYNELASPAAGFLTLYSPAAMHTAANHGEYARVHLNLDFRKVET